MRKRIFIAALSTVAMFFVMRWQNADILSALTPQGIINFELAKNFDEAKAMMAIVGVKPMQFSTGLDFLFIIAYTLFFSFCCKALMNNYRSSGLKTLGLIFLELSVLVGVLDLVENIAMLITLGGYGSNLSVSISHWSSRFKFSLAALVLLYIIVASILMYFISKKKA
ncbi:MAG: hypothetical protein H7178_09835 [Chitinophagaceae bacterium]|nr:hypothetical protein [Chitinophagaceae bacterium]